MEISIIFSPDGRQESQDKGQSTSILAGLVTHCPWMALRAQSGDESWQEEGGVSMVTLGMPGNAPIAANPAQT